MQLRPQLLTTNHLFCGDELVAQEDDRKNTHSHRALVDDLPETLESSCRSYGRCCGRCHVVGDRRAIFRPEGRRFHVTVEGGAAKRHTWLKLRQFEGDGTPLLSHQKLPCSAAACTFLGHRPHGESIDNKNGASTIRASTISQRDWNFFFQLYSSQKASTISIDHKLFGLH